MIYVQLCRLKASSDKFTSKSYTKRKKKEQQLYG